MNSRPRSFLRILGVVLGGMLLVLGFNLAVHVLLLMAPGPGAMWAAAVGAAFYWLHARRDSAGRPTALAARIRLRPLRASRVWIVWFVGSTLLVMLGIAEVIDLLVGPIETPENSYYDAVVRYSEPFAGWLAFTFGAAVVIPVIEEFAFRGRIQPVLEKRFGPAVGIIVTAALFASLHIGGPHVLLLLIPLALGAFAGAGVYLTGSIWAGVLLHGAWNGAMSLLGRVPQQAAVGSPDPGPAIGALVATVALIAGGIGWWRLLCNGRLRRPG